MCGELEYASLHPLRGAIKPDSVGPLEESYLELKTPTCKIHSHGQCVKPVVPMVIVQTYWVVSKALMPRVAPPNVQLLSSPPAAGAAPSSPHWSACHQPALIGCLGQLTGAGCCRLTSKRFEQLFLNLLLEK